MYMLIYFGCILKKLFNVNSNNCNEIKNYLIFCLHIVKLIKLL